ncbi:hypothetical protein [Crocosphaera sp. Alani8]|uniref:hypothetical protein n=1 Tax=Crocosphaera sp. Alani8 TaxID=3038952 RepID=UPI00313BB314
MKLFHPGLRELLNVNQYLKNHKMGFLTIETPLPQWFKAINKKIPYKIGLQLRREYRHLAMGLQSLKLQDVDSIYVMEIYNQHLLFLLPFLRLTNKPIFLGLHGNQTLAKEHWLKSLGFQLLKSYLASSPQSKAILLELNDDFCDAKYQLPPQSKLVIPHPIISEVEPCLKLGERLVKDYKFIIGIVGIVREDKPINQLLNQVITYAQKYSHCQVIPNPLLLYPL